VGLLPGPTGAQTEGEPDWLNLPYSYDDYGGWFRIWTNENTFDNGVRIINGDGSIFGSPYPGQTPEEYLPTEFQALWAQKCQPVKEQTFKTTRKIHLPGTPNKLQVSLGAWFSHRTKPSPIDRVQLLVNGIAVHEVKSAPGKPIPYPYAQRAAVDVTSSAHLVYGLNTFTVVAHKKPTKKSAGWCTGDNKFGVLAEVYGDHLADLAATAPKTVPGSEEGFVLPVTVTNNGPSTLPTNYGSFSASAWSDSIDIKTVHVLPGESCREPVPYAASGFADGWGISCTLPRMEPGATITYQVGFEYTSPAPPGGKVTGASSTYGYGENSNERSANNTINFRTQEQPSPAPSPS
jgi:hypothetical protein